MIWLLKELNLRRITLFDIQGKQTFSSNSTNSTRTMSHKEPHAHPVRRRAGLLSALSKLYTTVRRFIDSGGSSEDALVLQQKLQERTSLCCEFVLKLNNQLCVVCYWWFSSIWTALCQERGGSFNNRPYTWLRHLLLETDIIILTTSTSLLDWKRHICNDSTSQITESTKK